MWKRNLTVQIPVNNIPKSPDTAYNLVKNTDPEFVSDVIPNRWDSLNSVGNLNVLDIVDVTDSVRSQSKNNKQNDKSYNEDK